MTLTLLPPELLVRVAAQLPTPEECVRLERVGSLFRGPPPSPVELALQQRVTALGGSVTAPHGWDDTQRAWLVFAERRQRVSRRGGGQRLAACICHSLWLDANGGLHTCGTGSHSGILGHGEDVTRLLTPRVCLP